MYKGETLSAIRVRKAISCVNSFRNFMERNFRVYRVFHLFATTNVEYFVIINEEQEHENCFVKRNYLYLRDTRFSLALSLIRGNL